MDIWIRPGIASKLCICMALLLPVTALADAEQQYFDFMSRYYHLDEQAFTDITCTLEVAPMRESLDKIKQQLSGMHDKIKITDTLDKYQLIYAKSTGISFNDPSMSIDILSEQGMSNPDQVRAGINQVEQGFKNQVQGADTQLKGLFEGFESEKKSDITVSKATVTADGGLFEYKKKGVPVTDTITGPSMHTVMTMPSGDVIADSSYKTVVGDKLILDKFDMKMDQPLQTVNMHGTITYQSLGGIEFPEEIDEQGVIESTQSLKMQFIMSIKLVGCQLSK
jgi:hypothetical protein